jgi:CheY-like chemotaxis protein
VADGRLDRFASASNEVLRVPRVLIADDNSNVQKMVTLALKDAGIEVVAVGNGEAAVRKMPEITPDLVLADVFMPVRSGYEVCEFVKQDPRYMHTPVVLLVGAFDPLDEREAHRVQADGVLKKPFVPPDPLVSMVTSLLAKSAALRQVAVTVPAAEPAEAHVAKAVIPAPDESFEESAEEPPEEFATLPAGVTFADGEEPVAFGSLLETPAASTDQTDPVVTATRDPVLGEPAFWTSPPPAVEEPAPEDLTDGHSWEAPLPGRETPELLQPLVEGVLPESDEMEDGVAEFAATSSETVEDIEELAPAEEPQPEPESESQPEPQPEPEPELQQDEQSDSQVDAPHWDEAPVETVSATESASSNANPWNEWSSQARAEAEEPAAPELETATPELMEAPAPAAISSLPDAISEEPAVEQTVSKLEVPATVPQTVEAAAEPAKLTTKWAEMMSAKVEPAAKKLAVPAEASFLPDAISEEPAPKQTVSKLEAPATVPHTVEAAAVPAKLPTKWAQMMSATAEPAAKKLVVESTPAQFPEKPAVLPSRRSIELLSVREDSPLSTEPWKPVKESFAWRRNKQPELHAVAATITAKQPEAKLASAPSNLAIELAPSSSPLSSPTLTSAPSASPPLSSPPLSSMVPATAAPAVDLAATNPELMDALIARVIERMQPKMLEIVTHEILRPVVEALVRGELEKK